MASPQGPVANTANCDHVVQWPHGPAGRRATHTINVAAVSRPAIHRGPHTPESIAAVHTLMTIAMIRFTRNVKRVTLRVTPYALRPVECILWRDDTVAAGVFGLIQATIGDSDQLHLDLRIVGK